MKKLLTLDLISLRKATLILFFAIMLLSFSSCVALIDSLLGNSTCIEPGCDRDTSGHKAYCILHSDKEPVEVDTKTPYKIHQPLTEKDMKANIKLQRKNF